MNNSGKILGLIVSVLFAFGAVAIGTVYDSKRAGQLKLTTESKIIPSEKEGKTLKSSESAESKSVANGNSEKISSSTSEEKKAKELINAIIIDGQVQSDFTLDDYKAAKTAVDQLPKTTYSKSLDEEISRIEEALANMGIPY